VIKNVEWLQNDRQKTNGQWLNIFPALVTGELKHGNIHIDIDSVASNIKSQAFSFLFHTLLHKIN
jgi:hypothetical protein